MKLLLIIISLLTTSFVLGSNNQFFPIEDGLKWTYSVKENEDEFNQEVECTIIDNNHNDGDQFILETSGTRYTKYYYQIIDNIVYLQKMQVRSNFFPLKITYLNSSLIPVFILEEKNDMTNWRWQGKIFSILQIKEVEIVSEILGYDIINTEIGNYNCLLLTTTIKYQNTIEQTSAWFAKDIGLVKFESPKHSKIITKFTKAL